MATLVLNGQEEYGKNSRPVYSYEFPPPEGGEKKKNICQTGKGKKYFGNFTQK